MKLFDILKQSGLFANDIKLRIKNNQITINGDVIKDNIDLNINMEGEEAIIIDATDFLFWMLRADDIIKTEIKLKDEDENFLKIMHIRHETACAKENLNSFFEKNKFSFDIKNVDNLSIKLKIFGFEDLFGSNVKNDLTEILDEFLFVRTSKKEAFLLKKS